MKPTDTIAGPGRGDVEQFIAWLRQRGAVGPYDDWAREVGRIGDAVGLRRDVIWFQAAVETADFGPAARTGSAYWERDLNSGGLGIDHPGAPTPFAGRVTTGAEAARVHVATLWLVLGNGPALPVPLAGARDLAGPWLDHVQHRVADDPSRPPVRTLADLGLGYQSALTGNREATWADNPRYGQEIADRANASGLAIPDAPAPPAPAVPIVVNLIPPEQTNQRPGLALDPTFVTIHETANTDPGADAAMHDRWLHNGAPGAADPQVSVHFFVDDHAIHQVLPLDEVAWHAGDGYDGPGNRASLAIETCVNAGGDFDHALANVEWLVAKLIRERPKLSLDRVVQHNHWSGKDCPHQIRATGRWDEVLAAIRASLAGATRPPIYVPRVPLPHPGADQLLNGHLFLGLNRQLTVAAESAPCLQYADPAAQPVRDPLRRGQTVTALNVTVGEDGRLWIVTKPGTRIPAAALVAGDA